MSPYCLDTSAYTRFRLGDHRFVALIDSADWVGLPSVVLGELLGGFRLGRKGRENEMELWDFLADPATDVLQVDTQVAEHYAFIYEDLRRAGTPVPTNDMWIAACAAANGLTVLSSDDHFDAITRVGSIVLDPI